MTPDEMVAKAPVSPMGEVELRMGVQPLDVLHAQREALVYRVAPLRAMWGPNGLGSHFRKMELSKIQEILRGEAEAQGEKVSDAKLDKMGHADERYVRWLTQAKHEFIEWVQLEEKISQINEEIMRGQSVARFATAELHL
jgi:hypothetical protein